MVWVKRIDNNGNTVYVKTSTNKFVPGDIIILDKDYEIPCDAILLQGSCIVNESVITGQHNEITKVPLPDSNEIFLNLSIDNKNQVKHLLFAGTRVIKLKPDENRYVEALVIKTGHTSTKGGILKTIMQPNLQRISFVLRSHWFLIGLLWLLWSSIFYHSWPWLMNYFSLNQEVVLPNSIHISYTSHALNMLRMTINGEFIKKFVISVPSEFPIIASLAILFTVFRLKHLRIFCTNTAEFNISGQITCMVFDKTGTITKNQLTIDSLQACDGELFYDKVKKNQNLISHPEVFLSRDSYCRQKDDAKIKFLECMAAWHQVIYKNDKLKGDSLDIEMFKYSNWSIIYDRHESDNLNLLERQWYYPPNVVKRISYDRDYSKVCYRLKIEQVQEFDSSLKYMSVIVRNKFDTKNRYTMYVKGSPETIEKLSKPESIPKNYYQALSKFTSKGMRVLALAYKYWPEFNPLQKHPTQSKPKSNNHKIIKLYLLNLNNACFIEFNKDIIFWGFIAFSNEIKPEATGVIETLQEGKK